MCSKRQHENLTFGLHEYMPELVCNERIDDGQKNLLTPNSLNTICQYSFTCVCFAQLPFCKKREKLWQTLLSLKVSQQFANIQHTQVEIQLVIITLQFL
jgi:hypothetical protein